MADNSTSDQDDNRAKERANAESAANVIRQKLNALYAEEPNATAEAKEVAHIKPHSKHQRFMYELTHSGKSLAEIQTAWHNYYVGLPEKEKLEVWQEFYAAHQAIRPFVQTPIQSAETAKVQMPSRHQPQPLSPSVHHQRPPKPLPMRDNRSVADIKHQLLNRAGAKRKLSVYQHLQSLVFGLGLGSAVILILLFSFFNERFIAPFITPSRHVSSTPIIANPNGANVGPNPEVIIPKINVEIPVVYNVPTIEESAVEKGLERGVVHYATTPNPGEQGNVVIFGHSSNNIFNPGKYKFAFVLLSRLDNGDTFYLTKDGKLYVYKVYKKQIVDPTAVQVLGPADKPDTATLITCDPPGTSLHRLVVTGEQISPDPTTNTASTAVKTNQKPSEIPSNAPSLWQRIKDWF